MDANIKAKWLTDLRSGEYAQGKSDLKNERKNSFCCLGVLADQFNPEWAGGRSISANGRMIPVVGGERLDCAVGEITPNNLSGKLSAEFLASVGITDSQAHDLMTMNDCGKTFVSIADHIEKEL